MKSAPHSAVCGAKRRNGEPCQKLPIIGKKRCRLHGGKTPKSQNAGNANGRHTHGLYSSALTDDERILWAEMQLGNVDNELRLCRIQLHRAVHLESNINVLPNDSKNLSGFELAEVRRSTGNGKTTTDIVSRRPDIAGRMNWLLGRIAQLEKTRSELLTAAAASGKQGLDVRFVVEIPPEQNAPEWLASYRGTTLSSTPAPPAPSPDPVDDDEGLG